MEGLVALLFIGIVIGWGYLKKKSEEVNIKLADLSDGELIIHEKIMDDKTTKDLQAIFDKNQHRGRTDILADDSLDDDMKLCLLTDVHGCDEDSAREQIEIANLEIERQRKNKIRKEVKEKIREKFIEKSHKDTERRRKAP